MSEEINLNDLLAYQPETGSLTWKQRGVSGFSSARSCSVWNAKYAGKAAGSIHTDNTGRKCIHVTINDRKRKGHRVCWELINGPIPTGMTIDHIDHNPLNNRISNLRLATQTEQKRNMPISKNNSSGVVGVCWSKKAKRWRARIGVDGKVIDLGTSEFIEEAIAMRKRAEIEYGFHKNHGAKYEHK